MSGTHAKKHDINDPKNHIKKRLDLDGTGTTDEVVLSIPINTKFQLDAGSGYTGSEGWMKWNEGERYIEVGRTVSIDGGLLLEGESAIRGGRLANDSLTLYPSRVSNTPSFTFEGQSYAGFIVDMNKTEEIFIQDNAFTPTKFFSFWHSSDQATSPHVLNMGNGVSTTTVNINGFINNVVTHQLYAGDNASNYLHIDSVGNITLYGDARQTRELVHDAYNLYGNAATYNGVSCNAAGTGVINDFFYSMTLNGGSGWGGGPEAFITTFKLPADYEEGSDIDVVIHYTSDQTSGSAFIGVGTTPADVSYNKNDTYQTQTIPAPSTAYDRTSYSFTFSGSSLKRGDEVGVVVYRDPDNANDDMDGDAMITAVAVEYTANRIGGSV